MSTAFAQSKVASITDQAADDDIVVDMSEAPPFGETTWPSPNAFSEGEVVTTYGLSLHQERTIDMCAHSTSEFNPKDSNGFVFEFDGDAMRSHMRNAEDFILKRCIITGIDGDVPNVCTVKAYSTVENGTKLVPINELGSSHFDKEWHDAVLRFVPGQAIPPVNIVTGAEALDSQKFSNYINIDLSKFTSRSQEYSRNPVKGSAKSMEFDSFKIPISVTTSMSTAYANPIAFVAEKNIHVKNREDEGSITRDPDNVHLIVSKKFYLEFVDGITYQINSIRRTVPKGEKLVIVCVPNTTHTLPTSVGVQAIGPHHPIMQIQLVIVPYNLTHIQRQDDAMLA